MANNHCPHCTTLVPSESINIAEGVAMCPQCNKLSRLSALVEQSQPSPMILENIPRGCDKYMRGNEVVVKASLRSIGSAIGLLFFALFWNGIVSVFVLIALAGLYTNFIGPLPDWFPAPDFSEGDSGMTKGMTLFSCVFLTPFVLIGASLIGGVIITLFGSVQVRLRDEQGIVATGIGPLTWRRRFDTSRVEKVTTDLSSYEVNNQKKDLIRIDADTTVKFGSMLPEQRRRWMQAVLHVLLLGDAQQRDKVLSNAGTNRDFRRP